MVTSPSTSDPARPAKDTGSSEKTHPFFAGSAALVAGAPPAEARGGSARSASAMDGEDSRSETLLPQ
jgi:hypothetical protein